MRILITLLIPIIWIAILIYLICLATRLVKAVEKTALILGYRK